MGDRSEPSRDPGPAWMWRTLGVLLLFVGAGGVSGGLSLVTDPSGVGLGLDLAALRGSPFPDYLVPGLVLLAVNGVASSVAGVAALRRAAWAGPAGATLGAFLVAWIGVQVAVVGWFWVPPFQPVFLALGLAEVALGVGLIRARPR